MSRIPLLFVAAAATCLVAGVALGLGMGIVHDFRLSPVHAHINLVGWTSLALMGLALRAWPELTANRAAAWTQFGLSAASAFAFPFGIYLAVLHDWPLLAIVAGMVWFAGAILFLVRVVMLAFAGAPQRSTMALQPAE